jgi:acetylornithine deacetylase/succinyl-diaminopimelate desuccinylase-like protein
VVRLGGGTGLNSIPQEAWLDLDLRSEEPKALAQLDGNVRAALERAREDEDRRRTAGTEPLRLEIRLVGERPSGVTPRAHPLVLAAVAANRALGRDAELASASTDANVAIALGVPAIALGAGGIAGNAHLTTEWYEDTDGALGLVRALLVTAAMAEVS